MTTVAYQEANVSTEGYRAMLLEIRSRLTPTAHGAAIAALIETDQFGLHPSAATP